MASIQVLERKIHKHVKEHAEQFKNLADELHIIKSQIQRPVAKPAMAKDERKVTKRLNDLIQKPLSTEVSRKIVRNNLNI